MGAAAFRQALNGVVDNVPQSLREIAANDAFWSSWDTFRELVEELDEYYADSEDFYGKEAEYLSDAGLAEYEIALLAQLLLPAAAQAAMPADLPGGDSIRSSIEALADELEAAQNSNPQRGGFLRALGRGVLILGGATFIAVDAGVCVATGGVAALATASMGMGMASVAAGTFDGPSAARSFIMGPSS